MKNPVVIGCGNMGSAIIKALLQQGIYTAEAFTIVEKQENSFARQLAEEKAVVLDRPDELHDSLDLVILAVKPQDSESVLREIASKTNHETLVLSIMAGISIGSMESQLPQAQIIRCMPNTPCSVHQGMTVYCGNSRVSASSFQLAQQILSAMGKAFQVTDEIMIDAATAISGSGPAYVFYLAEALKEGATRLGFTDEQSDLLATQTLLGAAELLNESPDSPEVLRRKVTSPGGTTEAALNYFTEKDLKEELIKGFEVSFRRSLELGQK
ncbi:MAG: pyrroline-5-carboxylate reductase [Deltaproteobacteria bacterium]|jgi:pyrroline-5-carboxylate reductase|nr:pyrroline-5-carboxylate reductase [Deltaproteobacteria bacterium]MBT4089565.1 pyrroline-5-carboxylate reductase [Deltaproteobacteria bacterium]MBT4263935.1 pyrroline-5-carboxylate reductase [Deltaproteobacteria bacterium]MBT4639878.1 pyrroline-5-carboxylate reductase [Deltaproteobacteria bacterium]MBT6503437.1 pyrroline-5-carboxylate reductase [Deltaproteobacteria bacterium]